MQTERSNNQTSNENVFSTTWKLQRQVCYTLCQSLLTCVHVIFQLGWTGEVQEQNLNPLSWLSRDPWAEIKMNPAFRISANIKSVVTMSQGHVVCQCYRNCKRKILWFDTEFNLMILIFVFWSFTPPCLIISHCWNNI